MFELYSPFRQNCIVLLALGVLFISGCSNTARQPNAAKHIDSHQSIRRDSVELSYAGIILQAARDSDFATIARFVHPQTALRFVPGNHIDIFEHQQLSAEALVNNASKNVLLLWGTYAGTNLNIKLSVPQYFRKFVYSADFLAATAVSRNDTGTRDPVDNFRELYPEADFIEYKMSENLAERKEPQLQVLRLVFGWSDERCYLLAFIRYEQPI